jgi:hypothetical protein
MSGQSESSVRCLDLSSSESKLFHVDGAAGPILAYEFLFASPWSKDKHYMENKNTDYDGTDQANIR